MSDQLTPEEREAMEAVVSSTAYPNARAREVECFKAGLAARARVPVERPDEDDDAAIVEWFVRMQANAEASYIIEAAAEAIANADGWDWHDEDYESPDPKWQPTDKAEYRETARKAFAAARSVAAARLPEQPDEPAGTPDESDVRFPVKLNDAYTCQGRDRDGEAVTFDDLLSEGDRVASVTDEDGNHFAPFGVVVRREDGLWVELEPPTDGREHR